MQLDVWEEEGQIDYYCRLKIGDKKEFWSGQPRGGEDWVALYPLENKDWKDDPDLMIKKRKKTHPSFSVTAGSQMQQ